MGVLYAKNMNRKGMLTMAEYIEREELKQILLEKGFYPAIVKCALESLPTADVVEVRRGEWVRKYERYGDVVCSECRSVCHLEMAGDDASDWGWVRSNYCHNCGAKMDGKDD